MGTRTRSVSEAVKQFSRAFGKDEDYYQALARRGGTNIFAAIGFLLFFAVVLFAIPGVRGFRRAA